MTERLPAMAHDTTPDDQVDVARERIADFMYREAPILADLVGVPGMEWEVGEGWSTNLKTGKGTMDLSFFIERGYSHDDATFACLHELKAHFEEVVTNPELTGRVEKFRSKGEAESIFHNIFGDIAGNLAIFAKLPYQQHIADTLYRNKLFAETDYSTIPRHLQALYKTICQAMSPDRDITVLPEVDDFIESVRNDPAFGDLIAQGTQHSTPEGKLVSGEEKFNIWTGLIYPRWLELVETDKQDPAFQQSPGEGQPGEPSDQESDDTQSGTPDFSEYYQQYRTEHHPEPMSHEEHEAIEQDIADYQREQRQKEAAEKREEQAKQRQEQRESSPDYLADVAFRHETGGHSLAEWRRYQAETERWDGEIEALADVFRSRLGEHLNVRRRLRGGHKEGILHTERLAQTMAEIARGVDEPKAYMNYEKRIANRELSGKSDYVFIFDRSGSMRGNRSEAAASSAVICLEALREMQEAIEDAQAEFDDIDLDIRTAVYTFNDHIHITKPLSDGLTRQERLDTYADITQPGGNNADSYALQAVLDLPGDPDRTRTLIVVSDGQADDPALAREKVIELRRQGWQVIGVSIASPDAVELYKPNSRRIDDVSLLPQVMKELVEGTI